MMMIPNELKQLEQWVCWQLGDVNPNTGRPRKIPINPNTGKVADTTKPDTWGSYENAINRKLQNHRLDGVGLVLTEHDPFNCFDIDGATQLNGTPNTFIKAANSFTEQSQSNDGFHIFMTGNVPDINNTNHYQLYKAGQFIAMTGKHVDGTPHTIEPATPAFFSACKNVGILREEQPQQAHNNPPSNSPSLTDSQVLETLARAKNGGYAMSVFNGGMHKGKDRTKSAVVKATLLLLAPYCTDAEQLERIFKTSPHYDETQFNAKRKNSTWGKRECEHSVKIRNWTYNPSQYKKTAQTVEQQKKKQGNEPDIYWYVDSTSKGEVLKVDRAELIRFLEFYGYSRLWLETQNGDDESLLVRIKDNIAEVTSPEKIRDFLLKHAKQTDNVPYGFNNKDLCNLLLNSINTSLSEAVLKTVEACKKSFHTDTPERCYVYYKNGVVESTATESRVIPYSEIDGIIWKDQILNREFKTLPIEHNGQLLGDFAQFQKMTCCPAALRTGEHSNITIEDIEKRFLSLRTAMGYLMHRYSDPAEIRAVIFNDETINFDERRGGNGGTGKGLSVDGIREIRNVPLMDGKSFDSTGRFKYQTLSLRTDVVYFDDTKAKFDIESLYSVLSNGYYMEAKGKAPVKLPQAIKTVLTTNFVLKGDTPSDRRRRFEIEVSPYFAIDHTPKDEFGHNLFSDFWGIEQWQLFDNYMMWCIRDFLKHGLTQYNHVNLPLRRLIASTCEEFVEFVQDIPVNERLSKTETVEKFKEEYPDYARGMGVGNKRVIEWLKTYAEFKGYKYQDDTTKDSDGKKIKGMKSNGVRLFCLVAPSTNTQSPNILGYKEYPKYMTDNYEYQSHFDKCTEDLDGATKLAVIAECNRIYTDAYNLEPQASKKEDVATRQANTFLLSLHDNNNDKPF